MTIWQIMNGDCGYEMANRYFSSPRFKTVDQLQKDQTKPHTRKLTTYSARRDAMRILSSLRYRSFT